MPSDALIVHQWKKGQSGNPLAKHRSKFYTMARSKAEGYSPETIEILWEIVKDKYESNGERILAAGILLKVAGLIVSPTVREEANELANVMHRDSMEQLAQMIKDKCSPGAQKELLEAMGSQETSLDDATIPS